MTPPIKPRGSMPNASAEAGDRFGSSELTAFRQARRNGRSMVEETDGVFVISWHPITRANTDDVDTRDDLPLEPKE